MDGRTAWAVFAHLRWRHVVVDWPGRCARPRKCSGWTESKGGEEWTENLGSETRASKLSAMAAPWAELARKKGGEGKMTRTSNRECCDCRGSRSVVAPKRRCVQRKRIRRFVLGARAAIVASHETTASAISSLNHIINREKPYIDDLINGVVHAQARLEAPSILARFPSN